MTLPDTNQSNNNTCKIDSDCRLKVEWFEVAGEVDNEQDEDGGKVGEENFIDNLSAQHNLHFDNPTVLILIWTGAIVKSYLFDNILNKIRRA